MSLLSQAIDNNVHLCCTVLSQFDIRLQTNDYASVFHGTPRPYFPSVITRKPQLDDLTLAQIATLPDGAGVKDSFGTLDLAHMGFTAVASAHWIARKPKPTTGRALYRVDAASLQGWLDAWDAGNSTAQSNFTPALLDRLDIQLRATPDFHAGVILNQHGAGVTGLSNIFGAPSRVLAGLSDVPDGDTLVGYEADPAPFLDLGFTALGPLTIWIKTS